MDHLEKDHAKRVIEYYSFNFIIWSERKMNCKSTLSRATRKQVKVLFYNPASPGMFTCIHKGKLGTTGDEKIIFQALYRATL